MGLLEKPGQVVEHETWGDYHRLTVFAPAIASKARPGQFVMARVSSHYDPLLRRPFSLHDCDGERVKIFFKVIGQGTALLAQKKPGEEADLLGPLGNGFSLPAEPGDAASILVGGGRGIAPLRFLAQKLRKLEQKVIIFYGGKTRHDLPLAQELAAEGFELRLTTEDGSLGFKGLVTELLATELPKLKPGRLYVCGPEAMMHRIAEMSKAYPLPAEFSLEARMGCGFGVCYGCVWPIQRTSGVEFTRICQEGPVFSGEVIVWEKKS